MLSTWPCRTGDEFALCFDSGRDYRILVSPALFDESNKLRHFTAELMRGLDAEGLDAFLPDLPGQNESLADLSQQTLAGWADDMAAAAQHFQATHILAIRAGAALAPDLPGWDYAPLPPAKQLKSMLRGRTLAAREAGREETSTALLERGRTEGLELAGYAFGPRMIAGLADADTLPPSRRRAIAQAELPGAGLWLRAEPDHDADQVSAMAALIMAEARL